MSNQHQRLEEVLSAIDAGFDDSIDRLSAILRIPSISTDPAHDEDVKAAADWFADEFGRLGFSTEVVETPGHPVVFAERPAPTPDAPTILYYGHYDVQPSDPLDQWNSRRSSPWSSKTRTVVGSSHAVRSTTRAR